MHVSVHIFDWHIVRVTYLMYRDIYVAHREVPCKQVTQLEQERPPGIGQIISVVQSELTAAQSRVPVRLLLPQLKRQRTKQPILPPKPSCNLAAGAAVCSTNSLHRRRNCAPRLFLDSTFTAVTCNQLRPRTIHLNTETLFNATAHALLHRKQVTRCSRTRSPSVSVGVSS